METLLKKLISIKSVSNGERNIVDFISLYLKQKRVRFERIGNEIIAYSKGFETDGFIMFAGHTDTVPVANSSIRPKMKNGRMYGRGACDMKAGVAVMLKLAEENSSSCFVFYTHEETGLPDGMTTLLRKRRFLRKAKLAFVLEPTNNRVQYGCNGRILAKAVYYGKSGHASQPEHYENAVKHAAKVIAKIRTIKNYDGMVESISETGISGGSWANVIPDRCEAMFDYRYPPVFTEKQALRRLEHMAKSNLQIVESAPAATLKNAELKIFKKLFPKKRFEIMRGWTDVAQLQEAGIPAIVYGPGNIVQAHSDLEYVKIKDMRAVYETYRRILGI